MVYSIHNKTINLFIDGRHRGTCTIAGNFQFAPRIHLIGLGCTGNNANEAAAADFDNIALWGKAITTEEEARAVMEASGLPAIADDSGLCVDALNGAPGVYSARYGGLDDDAARCRLLLQNMRGSMTRAAHFHTSVVCLFPDGTELTAEGECPGTIAYAPMGDGGFGYDPVFYLPELEKTYAELAPEEKNAISHRARALQAFCRIYREEFEHDDK